MRADCVDGNGRSGRSIGLGCIYENHVLWLESNLGFCDNSPAHNPCATTPPVKGPGASLSLSALCRSALRNKGSPFDSRVRTYRCHSRVRTYRCHSRVRTDRCHSRVRTDRCHSRVRTDRCHSRVRTDSCHSRVLTDRCHSRVRTDRCHSRVRTRL